MIISKEKYICLKSMTNDLMKAEYFINILGIETRTDAKGDTFRNIGEILRDVVVVCNNNPTILNDCEEFFKTNPSNLEEIDRFLKNYNLDGIYKITN